MTDQTPGASNGLVALPAIQEMAKAYKLTTAAFAFTFRAVAMPKPHTEAEFVSCCLVAYEHELNPLTKEIYFMRDKTGAIQAIVGVDGWIKKCNEHPKFDGITFDDVLDKDGKALAIKARIFRSDRKQPIEITEYMSECVQNRSKPGPWQSHPNRMLRHRALIQCARIAFGFAGIMDRDEFDQWQAMKDVTPKSTDRAIEVSEIPDLHADDIPELPMDDDESGLTDQAEDDRLSQDQEEAALANLQDELAVASPGTRMEIADMYESVIDRMSKSGRARAEAILEGRAG